MNLALISLGCTKNQVDSEMLLDSFKNYGFDIVPEPQNADVIIVNTCGFIEDAKKEAIEVLLDMSEYKITGKCKHLFAFGCLAKRYKREIIESMPEVDLVVGVDEYDNLPYIIDNYFAKKGFGKLSFKRNILISNFPTAYIRISDGCNNNCTYCAIPMIRGKFRSRKIEDILEEVKLFASKGITEFVIISQDTTKYGEDIYGKPCLEKLINEISKVEGVKWIRILYMYLYELSDELINEIASNDKVCKYFDIPVQHISNNMLKLMNRKDNKNLIYDKIDKIRKYVKEATLRTTVMVGFPGETEDDFSQLLEFIDKIKFDRLGAFSYSKEEGTYAFNMENEVEEYLKKSRLDAVLQLQMKISKDNNKKCIGKTLEVLVYDVSDDEKYFVSRSYMDSPDVDGRVLIKIDKKSADSVIIGEYIKVKVIDFSEYDLYAEVI